jgi:hypothetical protein
MVRKPLTDQEILASAPRAKAEARTAAAAEPRAVSASYDAERDRIVVELRNGSSFAFPRAEGAGLAGATPKQLAAVEVESDGEGLHWEELDADISVPGILSRLLNARGLAARYMGRATSEAKAAAVRENGKKGGRPRKLSAEPVHPAASRRTSKHRMSADTH